MNDELEHRRAKANERRQDVTGGSEGTKTPSSEKRQALATGGDAGPLRPPGEDLEGRC